MDFYFLGGEVWCNCTEANMQIEGGHYILTKQLMKGSMLIYNCPDGYYPYPALTRLCQPNGRWRPVPKRFAPQRCRRKWCEDVSHFVSGCLLYMITKTILFCFAVVECPDPNVLEYGSVFPPQEKYFVDNETTYECYSGYTLRGSSRRVCLQNGKWSGSTPICSRDSKSKQQSSFFVPPFSQVWDTPSFVTVLFILSFLSPQQGITVLILVSQLAPQEQGTYLELVTQ